MSGYNKNFVKISLLKIQILLFLFSKFYIVTYVKHVEYFVRLKWLLDRNLIDIKKKNI